MATKKKSITSVPKAIRNEVKSLFKHALGKNPRFQFGLVYIDDTGTIGTATAAGTTLADLTRRAADDYQNMRAAFLAGQESATA